MVNICAVDLFCGAGGLTHGLIKSGVSVVAGIDVDSDCQYAYEKNNKAAFIHKDIRDVSADSIATLYPHNSIRLLAGCAPCQPFSRYNRDKNKRDDEKWPLLYEFSRIINNVQPELVTMENVPGVIRHSVYTDFVDSLVQLGYSVWAKTIKCHEIGIPQTRKRHVLLASRIGVINPTFIPRPPHKFRTVRQAISRIPPLNAGERSATDHLHRCQSLTPLNLKRIQLSKPGGTWRDWPESVRAQCHRKDTGKSYSSVYSRMSWDEPSPTITTQCFGFGNGRFGHPEQDRSISLREAAVLQTFPYSYKFFKDTNFSFVQAGKLIGNAVPVTLAKFIGQSFNKHIANLNTYYHRDTPPPT